MPTTPPPPRSASESPTARTDAPPPARASALPRRAVVGYAAGSVGTGGFGTLPGLVLAYYLTDTLGVGAGLASLVVTVPKVWDVLLAPAIGAASDTSAARRGTRRPFLLSGALTLPLLFASVFAVPAALTGGGAAWWVVVTFLLAATAYSVFQVPYIALPADIAPDYATRTRLVAPRIAVLAVAILAFGAGGPALRDAAGGGRTGYLLMGAVCGVALGLGMLGAWWGAPKPASSFRRGGVTRPSEGVAAHLRAGFAVVADVPAFRRLLGAFVLQALATGGMLAGAQYVATYTLGDENDVTFLFAALVAPALLVMPAATRVARRVGKRRALVGSTALFVVAALALLPMQWVPGPWVYGPVALAGVAYAGMQLYPLAMLPDVIAVDARERGAERAGILSGVWTAGETAGLALGPTLVLGILAVTGFVSHTATEAVAQPASARLGVVLAFTVLPAALTLLSLVPLSRYPLSAAVVDASTDPEPA